MKKTSEGKTLQQMHDAKELSDLEYDVAIIVANFGAFSRCAADAVKDPTEKAMLAMAFREFGIKGIRIGLINLITKTGASLAEALAMVEDAAALASDILDEADSMAEADANGLSA